MTLANSQLKIFYLSQLPQVNHSLVVEAVAPRLWIMMVMVMPVMWIVMTTRQKYIRVHLNFQVTLQTVTVMGMTIHKKESVEIDHTNVLSLHVPAAEDGGLSRET